MGLLLFAEIWSELERQTDDRENISPTVGWNRVAKKEVGHGAEEPNPQFLCFIIQVVRRPNVQEW